MDKKLDKSLAERVLKIREGIGKQPLATLAVLDPTLRNNEIKMRRILWGKVFPGDLPEVERLEKAKARYLKLRKED